MTDGEAPAEADAEVDLPSAPNSKIYEPQFEVLGDRDRRLSKIEKKPRRALVC